jgi:hypothetical protein
MQRGTCKLCLSSADLQGSHFLPKAIYKTLRTPSETNPNPVVMTPKISSLSSKQMKDYVLCRSCEQRFSKNGESWVMKHICREGKFPLLDLLRKVKPDVVKEGWEAYACAGRSDIDADSLAYFALSVLWRASVHGWAILGARIPRISVGPYLEPIRRFLLGTAGFPPGVVVFVTAATDFASQNVVHEPVFVGKRRYEPWRTFELLVRGICFRILLGAGIPLRIRVLCCAQGADRYLFAKDMENETVGAFAGLFGRTRVIGILKDP